MDYAESALELVPDLINSPDETNRLAELGLIEDDVLDNAKTAMKWRLALLKWIDEELTKLAEVKEDLATITREIENFRKNAETYFYEWVREVYVYPQYK